MHAGTEHRRWINKNFRLALAKLAVTLGGNGGIGSLDDVAQAHRKVDEGMHMRLAL